MRETDWTKILGWPGYRVYRHEIEEKAKTLKLWVRRTWKPENWFARAVGGSWPCPAPLPWRVQSSILPTFIGSQGPCATMRIVRAVGPTAVGLTASHTQPEPLVVKLTIRLQTAGLATWQLRSSVVWTPRHYEGCYPCRSKSCYVRVHVFRAAGRVWAPRSFKKLLLGSQAQALSGHFRQASRCSCMERGARRDSFEIRG